MANLTNQFTSSFNIINFSLIGHIFTIILSILSIFFLFLISYCVIRMFEVREKEEKYLEHEIAEYAHHQKEREKKLTEEKGDFKNPRWRKILEDIFSPTVSDWKLAIIEADAMLEDLTNQMGFQGQNLGEKLKSANKEKFHSLNQAWEAHNVRNRIAHEGSNFELSSHEAKRVIALYEQVFREFGFI